MWPLVIYGSTAPDSVRMMVKLMGSLQKIRRTLKMLPALGATSVNNRARVTPASTGDSIAAVFLINPMVLCPVFLPHNCNRAIT